jgi:hypothetical protein
MPISPVERWGRWEAADGRESRLVIGYPGALGRGKGKVLVIGSRGGVSKPGGIFVHK